ncbi:hypothetical protein KCP69_26430 [Salmonella enterica subsp. enterica]|nr:hypothetical protein KCP69_26430 [Salmonella enterica subsp. enterica]
MPRLSHVFMTRRKAASGLICTCRQIASPPSWMQVLPVRQTFDTFYRTVICASKVRIKRF